MEKPFSREALSAIPSWLKTVTNNGVGISAPDLFYFGGEYRSYYTGSAFGKNTGYRFCLSNRLYLDSSDYNWVDEGEVVRSVSSNNYNAIDADVVEDADGNYWMAFGLRQESSCSLFR